MIAVSERVFLSMLKDKPEVLTVPEAAKLLRIGVSITHIGWPAKENWEASG